MTQIVPDPGADATTRIRTWGLVRANTLGWGDPQIVGSLVGGAAVVAIFGLYEA